MVEERGLNDFQLTRVRPSRLRWAAVSIELDDGAVSVCNSPAAVTEGTSKEKPRVALARRILTGIGLAYL
jgi:hypothetical protein